MHTFEAQLFSALVHVTIGGTGLIGSKAAAISALGSPRGRRWLVVISASNEEVLYG